MKDYSQHLKFKKYMNYYPKILGLDFQFRKIGKMKISNFLKVHLNLKFYAKRPPWVGTHA